MSIYPFINPVVFQNVFIVLFLKPTASKQHVNSPKQACRITATNVAFSSPQLGHIGTKRSVRLNINLMILHRMDSEILEVDHCVW